MAKYAQTDDNAEKHPRIFMTKEFFSSEKKIYDSVHGFIHFDDCEKLVIGSFPFQRLHYIHQLGIAYLVYPGATHTRFEHSLGVMELASRVFHNVCKTARPDVFPLVPRTGSPEYFYWRKVLRMAALCHDLGHLPFSHVAEKDLLGEEGHEAWTYKIIQSKYLAPVWENILELSGLHQDFPDRNVCEDITKMAIGEKKWHEMTGASFTFWERVISAIITGDFFGADRIDYLLRDSKSTGVAYGLFDYQQLIEMIRILPSVENGAELALGINENGLESCEALLLARHFMHRRVYQYASVKAYNFHLRRFMKNVYPPKKWRTVEEFLRLNDAEVITELHVAAEDPKHIGHEDAKCIIYRKDRFRALPLSFMIPEDELKSIQAKVKVPKGKMEWEIKKASPLQDSLSFPVSRSHLMVEKAKECSELLCKVTSSSQSWVYISSDYEVAVAQALDKWRISHP